MKLANNLQQLMVKQSQYSLEDLRAMSNKERSALGGLEDPITDPETALHLSLMELSNRRLRNKYTPETKLKDMGMLGKGYTPLDELFTEYLTPDDHEGFAFPNLQLNLPKDEEGYSIWPEDESGYSIGVDKADSTVKDLINFIDNLKKSKP